MLKKLFAKKTNFVGGDLIPEEIPLSGPELLSTAKKFRAPRKIDHRDMLLTSSNQGQTPHCAGYSTAGLVEYYNWKTLHYPKQEDGDAIYLGAKEIDGFDGDGTTLSAAAKAAIAKGLIKGKTKYVAPTRRDIKFAVHEHDVVLAGFKITNEWNFVSKKGIIPIFKNGIIQLGGHAVLICGYDKNGVYIQNSWGPDWGLHGFALIPWEMVDKQLMSALVIIRKAA